MWRGVVRCAPHHPSPDISLHYGLETTSRQFSEVQAPGNAAVLPQLTADGPCRRPTSHDTPPSYRRGQRLPQPLRNHRLPRHQPESQAIVQHGKTPAGEHHATLINATNALAIGHRRVLPDFQRMRQKMDAGRNTALRRQRSSWMVRAGLPKRR